MHVVRHVLGAVKGRLQAFFSPKRVWFQPAYADAMHFMVCNKCNRLVPHWRYCLTAEEYRAEGALGCRCGSIQVRPAIVPEWQALWWLLVRGLLIRRVLQQKAHWDPRSVIVDTTKHVNA